jgi:hypothetical protein
MAGRPWAVVVTAAVSALVAAGALLASAMTRDSGVGVDDVTPTTPATPGVGVDGCQTANCTVLATVPVGDTLVELVSEPGGTSGRLRIGGAGSSEVIEVTITEMGATLTTESLHCVPDSLAACLVGGPSPEGFVGQVVVGRSTQWSELAELFLSDAGYIALADVTADPGAEVLVGEHRCDRQVTADCAPTPVYVRVHNLRRQELGCTRNYTGLDSLPGWPTVTLKPPDLRPCA